VRVVAYRGGRRPGGAAVAATRELVEAATLALLAVATRWLA